ncbi:hypothetical protein M514_26153 [Trichuris suis]|uniref:Uncharacterized protein n=1 Tax=Trichuris suis TaxID=68888 RepID=A0A085MWU5_9BILA|nr:hypothetical protein M514_26153 [Trichuris suis]
MNGKFRKETTGVVCIHKLQAVPSGATKSFDLVSGCSKEMSHPLATVPMAYTLKTYKQLDMSQLSNQLSLCRLCCGSFSLVTCCRLRYAQDAGQQSAKRQCKWKVDRRCQGRFGIGEDINRCVGVTLC